MAEAASLRKQLTREGASALFAGASARVRCTFGDL